MRSLVLAAVALVTIVALDLVWLGQITSAFYKRHLAPIGRFRGTDLDVDLPSAGVVYLLLAVGLVAFVVPRAEGRVLAGAAYGALFGAVVYGVYDFTNRATLAHFPLVLALADAAWGTALNAILGAVLVAVDARFFGR